MCEVKREIVKWSVIKIYMENTVDILYISLCHVIFLRNNYDTLLGLISRPSAKNISGTYLHCKSNSKIIVQMVIALWIIKLLIALANSIDQLCLDRIGSRLFFKLPSLYVRARDDTIKL